jgi:zinc protease
MKKASSLIAAVLSIVVLIFFSGKVYAMEIFTIENRLPVTFETRKDTGVVAIQVWVKVGSKYEEPRVAGITHFIEHLIFKGTETVKAGEMASRIEALGGSVNAFTSYDNTVYHIIVPKKAFEDGLNLLLDAVKNPVFPEEEINKERRVVLEEIKMNEDDPQRKLFRELFALSYRGHPYGRPIIGFEEVIRSVTREDVVTYFKEHYTLDNMAVVVTGDFDPLTGKALLARFVKGYGDRRAKAFSIEWERAKEPDKSRVIEKDVRESYVSYSFPAPPMIHKDTPALDVLAKVLGDGDSSRLQDQLKFKQGIVSNVSTFLFSPKEEGLFVITASFQGRTFDGITKAIDQQIARLEKDGPTPWELKKAKNIIRASYTYSKETAQGRARQIGNYQTLTGDPHYPDVYLAALDKVGTPDIKKAIKKYLGAEDKRLVALIPRGASNPHTFKLKNGLTYVVNKNQSSPSFSFRIGFVGGLKEEPAGKNGVLNLLSRMLTKGTQKKDAAAIAREIELVAGDISPYNGRTIFGLSGKFLNKDLKKAFTLLHELLTGTLLKEDELAKVKEDVLSAIRQRDDEPVGSTFRRFTEVIFEGHPYSKDPLGTEADVRRITAKDVQDAYRQFVTPANTVLSVSGDIDEDSLRQLLDKLFSNWKGPSNNLGTTPVEAKKQEVVVPKDIMQSHLIFGFLGPGLLDSDRYAVEVMDAVLSGMGGRIHKVLREENPYAYALTFFNQMAYDIGAVGIYIGTDRKHVGEVERISRAEIEKILQDGFSDREVADGKNYLVGNHYISMQSNSAIATSMCLDTMYGLKPDYFKRWPKYIENVKTEDVNRVARKYLVPDKMVYVRSGMTE